MVARTCRTNSAARSAHTENLPFGHRTTGLRPQLLGVMPNLLPPPGEPVSQNFRGCCRISLTWSLVSQPNRP
ncbi:hypothetical protein AXF42_Ash000197 [Apostasia shenzhenica]|uniref:Uncharacterized protein n=1 Tax=Apostasia shenzhenica TaxID=1088818 RepID=A0A2I0AFN2_9ASPA|nr:hypothetical protein AXF42_Ash000197 [Apostasia shenzhenica]